MTPWPGDGAPERRLTEQGALLLRGAAAVAVRPGHQLRVGLLAKQRFGVEVGHCGAAGRRGQSRASPASPTHQTVNTPASAGSSSACYS
jgi:hypothetical protein